MKFKTTFAILFLFNILLAKVALANDTTDKSYEAVYLGIQDYGTKEVNKNNKNYFRYRFNIAGKEAVFFVDNGLKNKEGEYDYHIQNLLKEGYAYNIIVNGNNIVAVKEIESQQIHYKPFVSGIPGYKTLKNFLKTAMMPVGTTLYIYGGGWNWQDVSSSIQSRTLGVSSDWVKFFHSQNENFTYKSKDGDEKNAEPTTSYYPFGEYNEYYYAGLDCSGYLAWILYNTFETESGRDGYIESSTKFAKKLSEKGWGEWMQDVSIHDGSKKNVMKPGDIMSMNGHVWISLGTCNDGSIVITHCTPSDSRTGQPGGGVQIGAIGVNENCEAYMLAKHYMSTYFPEWYKRYNIALKNPNVYFKFEGKSAGRFSWNVLDNRKGLIDPDGIQKMLPDEVLKELFFDNM